MNPQDIPTGTVDPFLEVQKQKFNEDERAEKLERLTPNAIVNRFKYLENSRVTWRDDVSNFDEQMERYEADTEPVEGTTDYNDAYLEKGALRSSSVNRIPPDLVRKAITELIKDTGNIRIDLTSISSNTTGWITLSITDTIDASRTLFALSEATYYEDVLLGSRHVLTTPEIDRMHLFTHYDISQNIEDAVVPGKSETYFHAIHNDDASSHDYIGFIRMRFVGRIAESAS